MGVCRYLLCVVLVTALLDGTSAVQYCPSPPRIANARSLGYYYYRRIPVNGTIEYSCRTGYEFNDTTETVTCQQDGSYSTPYPICLKKDCGTPKYVSNGKRNFTNTTYLSYADYKCDKGYVFPGGTPTKRVRCLVSGEWQDPSECSPRNCWNPGSVLNGNPAVYASTLYGSIATYTCKLGYKTHGNARINCTEKGWSTRPKCIEVVCENPPNITNAKPDKNSAGYNQKVTYRCRKGYVIDGHDYVTCQGDSTWSEAPICQKIDCRNPPNIHYGSYDSVEETTHGSKVMYTCKSGYQLIGVATIECLDNGQWSSVPSCEMPPGMAASSNNNTALGGLAVTCAVLILVVVGFLIYSIYITKQRKDMYGYAHYSNDQHGALME